MSEREETLHWQRTHGTSFGSTAGAYAANRPAWPAPTAAWLIGLDPAAPAWPSRRVLDLGAGTGKLTETLVAAGHDVLAVDADEAMIDQLLRDVPRAQARVGTAEAIPEVDSGRDAITVAQAWHWFDAERAAAECARVLRPGGVLGVAWHLRDERVPWVEDLSAAVGRPGDVARVPRGEPMELPPPFRPVEHEVFEYALETTPEGLRDLADTWSYVRLSPERADMLDAVLEIGRSAADADGRLVVPHITRCYRAVRR